MSSKDNRTLTYFLILLNKVELNNFFFNNFSETLVFRNIGFDFILYKMMQ